MTLKLTITPLFVQALTGQTTDSFCFLPYFFVILDPYVGVIGCPGLRTVHLPEAT